MKNLPSANMPRNTAHNPDPGRVERLEMENAQLTMMLDLAPGAIIVHDEDGRFFYANQCAFDLHGYSREEFMQLTLRDLVAPCDTTLITSRIAAIFEKGNMSFEVTHRRKDGTEFPLMVNVRHIQWGNRQVLLSVDTDLTESKKAERALLRAEKLESLGILAAGIAHDFNNLLNGVFGYIDLARITAGDERTMANLNKAFAIFGRAKELCAQLVTFSKGGAPVKKISSVGKLIKTTVSSVVYGTPVAASFSIPDDLHECDIDENQIAQAIRYITVNAREAMAGGGRLVVTAVNVSANGDIPSRLPKKDYVRISFRDNGPGITTKHLPLIFDPFFTTKVTGSGLGLTTAHSIAKRHQGTLFAVSEPGLGAEFILYLPAVSRKRNNPV